MLAQQKVTVSGTITDAETKEPIVYANVAFPDLGIGTSSDEKGEFTIQNVNVGNYTLSVTYIGYKEYSINITLNKDVDLKIKLQQQSLGLKEVLVTAESSKSGATSSKIRSEAISHVQASSIKDVMQLIPGNISENPDLSKPGKISIREIGDDVNSALGTSIIVDNIPLSNDGNMQQSIQGGFQSVAGTGVDLRSISVDNIESITVDVGIPSAEHGNLTSGAVHIKTKAGGSAYNAKLQTDPHTKQAYLGKGYLLQKDLGVINVDFGYTQSYKNLVEQTDLYKRINATTKYSKTFFRGKSPLQLDVKLDFINSLDGKKWDPDMILEEENHSKDQQFRSNLTANWSLDKPYITNLSFDFGFDKTWQEGFEKIWEQSSSGPNFFSTATEDGEYEIQYGPSGYYSEVTYDGKPFNVYSKLKAKLFKKTGILTNNIMLGAEWRTTGNNGAGRIFDPTKPPSGGGTRPRPFTDIPSLNQFSLFAEDKIILDLGTTELNIMAGLRMDNIQPDGLFKTNGSIGIDPRINIKYGILNRKNNSLFRDLSFRFGYGQTTKAPTLNHLYPDKKYNDVESFNYYPDLIVYTTDVVEDTRNYNLNPSKGNKYETGLDFQIKKVKGRVTLFYEKFTGGFDLDRTYYPIAFRDYNTIDAGLNPYYVSGEGIYYNDETTGNAVAVGYEDDVTFRTYSVYRNANRRIKKGVEYSLNTGTIEALRTSFNITGAWFYTESYSANAPYWEREYYTEYTGNSSSQESFAVKFTDEHGYGTIAERLNTNFSIINHIPELRMLISLNTQVVWFQKDRRKFYPETHKLYTLSELRDYLDNADLFSYENEDDFYYYIPVSYKGYDNIEHEYTIADFEEPLNQNAIEKIAAYRFAEETMPVLVKCDIKISKDIGDRFKLSFYANNFLNIRPWYLSSREGTYKRRNQVPYFGADIKMQF
ncbi:TonB-dependent receptor [Prolixibacteraceae bacterium Z1-6]|uniref:TonB-dependent receptor n=1 Tax=Draconibacterium aestuarii TaxID=2998507 RepID=A0A9X3F290_9BACT|nr:TonB-dependent receptor [Prolixibacteraceae bacterium Z1-6]